jgi:hypothetical protein
MFTSMNVDVPVLANPALVITAELVTPTAVMDSPATTAPEPDTSNTAVPSN